MKRNLAEYEWTFEEIIEEHFPKISLTALSAMSRATTPWKVKKRKPSVAQGELCNRWVFVSKGLTRIMFTKAGKTDTLFFDGEAIFTSFRSLVSNKEGVFTLEALSDCWGWQISHDDYTNLTAEFPEILNFETSVLRKQLSALECYYERRAMSTPEDRFYSFEETWPDFFINSHTSSVLTQYIPQKILASYLSMTPTMLSILRRREIERQRNLKEKR